MGPNPLAIQAKALWPLVTATPAIVPLEMLENSKKGSSLRPARELLHRRSQLQMSSVPGELRGLRSVLESVFDVNLQC